MLRYALRQLRMIRFFRRKDGSAVTDCRHEAVPVLLRAHDDDGDYTVEGRCRHCEEPQAGVLSLADAARLIRVTESELAEMSFGWCPDDGGHWTAAEIRLDGT